MSPILEIILHLEKPFVFGRRIHVSTDYVVSWETNFVSRKTMFDCIVSWKMNLCFERLCCVSKKQTCVSKKQTVSSFLMSQY